MSTLPASLELALSDVRSARVLINVSRDEFERFVSLRKLADALEVALQATRDALAPERQPTRCGKTSSSGKVCGRAYRHEDTDIEINQLGHLAPDGTMWWDDPVPSWRQP